MNALLKILCGSEIHKVLIKLADVLLDDSCINMRLNCLAFLRLNTFLVDDVQSFWQS